MHTAKQCLYNSRVAVHHYGMMSVKMLTNKGWIKLNHTWHLNEEFCLMVNRFISFFFPSCNLKIIYTDKCVFVSFDKSRVGASLAHPVSPVVKKKKKKLYRMINESHFNIDRWMWLSHIHFLFGKSNNWLGIMKEVCGNQIKTSRDWTLYCFLISIPLYKQYK